MRVGAATGVSFPACHPPVQAQKTGDGGSGWNLFGHNTQNLRPPTTFAREGVRSSSPDRLTLDRGAYQGARPYYTVAYLKPSGSPQALRYTPFLERAEFLFERFCRDITDPARFGTA